MRRIPIDISRNEIVSREKKDERSRRGKKKKKQETMVVKRITFWFQDTMMDCEGDAGGLDELVELATDVADSSPTIRGN